MEKHFVKIYGKRRTGTNFILFLVRDNCINTLTMDNQFGGKHHRPRRTPDHFFSKESIQPKLNYWKETYNIMLQNKSMHSIVIIKNPYSWYYSIKRYLGNSRFEKFNFKSVYSRYNMLYSVYKDFYHNPQSYGDHFGKVAIVKYENLLTNPKKYLGKICAEFGIPMKEKITVRNKVNMSPKFSKEKTQFYLRNDTFDLPKDIHNDINNIIDWEIMNFYGYERIDI